MRWTVLLILASGMLPQAAAPQVTGAGRVVAIVTALDGTVRIPGVEVELLSLDRNVIIARTVTEALGRRGPSGSGWDRMPTQQ